MRNVTGTETSTQATTKEPKPMNERQAARNLRLVDVLLGAGLMALVLGAALLSVGDSKWLLIAMMGAMIGVFAHAVNKGIPIAFRKGFWDRFAKDKVAVSPVIAVILMVAITVVLAATVFVMVSDIGRQKGSTGFAIGIEKDESLDRLRVNEAGERSDWHALEFQSSNPIRWALNEPASDASPAVAVNEWFRVTSDPQRIKAGDFVEFCGQGAQTETPFIIRNSEANTFIGQWTLNDLASC